jgi:hypothetical protein
MAAYGAIALPETEQRRRSGRLVAVAAALVAASSAALLAVSLPGVGRAQLLQMQAEVRMNMVPLERSQMLCEGHFLDTATGIPEGTYSTLHHPGELEGYAEPLPPEMRAAIDQRIYGAMVCSPCVCSSPLPLPPPPCRLLPFTPACACSSRRTPKSTSSQAASTPRELTR